jgi:hypothetical protein
MKPSAPTPQNWLLSDFCMTPEVLLTPEIHTLRMCSPVYGRPPLANRRKCLSRRVRAAFMMLLNMPAMRSEKHRKGTEMGKRDDLIAKYADDLKTKCRVEPDMALLTKVTIGCGPSIYGGDAATVAGSQPAELAAVKRNFLVGKLGMPEGPDLDAAIDKVMETYGRSERHKYRAVVYYLLTKHFGKEAVYR